MSLPRDLWLYAGAECLARYGTICRRTWPADRHGEDYKETFTRATAKLAIGSDGILRGVGINVLAPQYPPGGLLDQFGNPLCAANLEAAATNKLTAPEDLSNAAWTKTGTTVPSTTNGPSPRNDGTASFLREDGTTGNHLLQQGFARAVNGTAVGVSILLKANGRTKAQWRIQGSGSANTVDVQIDLGAGTAVLSSNGTGTGIFVGITPLANSWYWVTAWGVPSTGETAVTYALFLKDGSGNLSYAGDGASGMYVWGCVATDGQLAGLYWGTGASRSTDSLTLPHAYKPQRGWWYFKWVDQNAGAGNLGNWAPFVLGNNNGAGQARIIFDLGGGSASFYHQPNGLSVSSSASLAPNAFGQVNEALMLLFDDGSIQTRVSVNGGAEVVGAQSGPAALWTFWSGNIISYATVPMGLVAMKGGPGVAVNSIPIARSVGGP